MGLVKQEIAVLQLLRNSPYLSDREFIYPGETLVISYADNIIMKLSINGYAYPFIDKDLCGMKDKSVFNRSMRNDLSKINSLNIKLERLK